MIASIFLCAFGIRSSSTNHVSATLRINCTARVNAVPAVTVCVYFPLNFLSTSSYLKQPSNDHQVTQKLSSNDLRVILRIFLRRRSIEETRWRFQNRTFYQAYRATLYNMIFRINDLQVPDSVSAVDSVCFHLRPDAKGNAVARCGLTECSRRNSGSSEFRLTIRWIFPRLFRVFLLWRARASRSRVFSYVFLPANDLEFARIDSLPVKIRFSYVLRLPRDSSQVHCPYWPFHHVLGRKGKHAYPLYIVLQIV